MASDALNPLARTAISMPATRAVESKRRDALFVDPLAAPLAGERAVAWLERQSVVISFWPVIRTRFLDDLLGHWMQQTFIRQVVLLAAGLDTRAYRLT
ncbi:MAG: class I SAM-dependent methyltransferase [Ktedonobacteraceae bacterium]